MSHSTSHRERCPKPVPEACRLPDGLVWLTLRPQACSPALIAARIAAR